MLILFISIIALGIIVGCFALFSKNGGEQPVNAEPTCATCTGENTKCEQECMMEASTKPIEYYDDEHLDKYQGRPSDSYNDDEIEEFSEVLFTLQQHDAAGWNRSLILRNINLPNELKDDLLVLINN